MLNIFHSNGLNIDLFIYHCEGKNFWHGSNIHRWVNSKFSLKKYKFYNNEVYGPANPEIYLTENYGDWKTPLKEFNFVTCTPNLALVKNPSSLSLFLIKISRSESKLEIEKTLEILNAHGYINENNEFKIKKR